MDRTILVFFCATVLGLVALALAGDLRGGRGAVDDPPPAALQRLGARTTAQSPGIGGFGVRAAAMREPCTPVRALPAGYPGAMPVMAAGDGATNGCFSGADPGARGH